MPRIPERKKLTAVGCYIFAGGFTVGVRQAGFDVLCHLEEGNFGTATAAQNWPNMPIHTDPATWPTRSLRGKVDLVYCNPPCSSWSNMRIIPNVERQLHWSENPTTECLTRAFSLLSKIRPRVWCFESVRQIWTKARDLLSRMSDEAARLGYSTTHLFTAASDYGVPQRRLRYFMLCHDVKLNFAPSGQTDLPTVYSSLEKVSHANDLQVNCPESVRGIMPSVEQGKNVRSTWDRLYKDDPDLAPSRRPAFLYDRLLGDGVSYTITGGCTKLHPDEDRLITVNEAKALCCYPPSFRFIGGAGSVFAQLGKGVMPPVARWLATNIRRGIETGVKSDHPHETVLTATALTISQGPPSKVKIKL